MKLLLLLAVLPTISLARFNYEGYKVYRMTLQDYEQATILPSLRENVNYNFFTETLALNMPIDIMVKPNAQSDFINTLEAHGIEYIVVDENVESKIEKERQRLQRATKLQRGSISFSEFHRYDVIDDYLNQLAVAYPDIVQVEQFGESLEGRPLTLIRIGTGSSDNPSIIIESTIHSREWIAPAVTTFIIHQLVENPNNLQLVENINWIIIPVLNPDGYEFTFTTDRLWRKTRRPGEDCYGVDGNRNFGFQWGGNGTSTNQCTDIYIGPYPYSEPEVASYTNVALETENLVLYLSMHSFGNWLLFPWGWLTQPVENHDEHQQLGEAVADSIASVNGTRYTVGPAAQLLYYAAGNSMDWMHSIGTPLCYVVELPAGPVGGWDGFIVPPERIVPISEEFWAGIETYADYAVQRWRSQK